MSELRDIDGKESENEFASKTDLSWIIFLSSDLHKSVALAEETISMCRAIGDRFNEAELLNGPYGLLFPASPRFSVSFLW